jgi:ABC-type dipeptide/oligopeptide/nickel transport system permease component
MKKIVVMIMVVVMMMLMCACATTTSVTSEVVEAVVTNASSTTLRVEYGGVHAVIRDGDLYKQYHNNLGAIIRMVLITRTYESGTVEQTLVFNENVHNGGGLK